MALDREKAIEIIIEGKQYAIVPLCTFHDVLTSEMHGLKSQAIQDQYGLRDTLNSREIYEIVDEQKYMLAKIKYAI